MHRLTCNVCRLLLVQSIVLLLLGTTKCSSSATHAVVPVTTIEEAHHPQYAFSYAVYDPNTNDKKANWETRNGDQVNGAYSLLDPDGTVRIVEYNANDAQGFSAFVKKIGDGVHPTSSIVQNVLALNPVHRVNDHTIQPVPIPLSKDNIEIQQSPVELQLAIQTRHNIEVPSFVLSSAPPIGVPKVNFQRASHPWDPISGSYGGWRPLHGGPNIQATLITRKHIDGYPHKIVTGPIPLIGKTLVIRKVH